MYINTFKYTPKDVSCQLCTEYVKKLGCTALRCPWLAERIEAGVVGYREAVLETFPHERRLFQRLNLLIKHYPGSLWSNEQHERRMQYQCAVQGYRRRRDTIAKLLEQLKNDRQKHQYSKANPHGKMTVKQLAAKDKGLQSNACPGVTIREDRLLDMLADMLQDALDTELGQYTLSLAELPRQAADRAELREKITSRRQEIQQLRGIVRSLYENLVQGVLTKDEYFDYKEKYESRIADLAVEMEQLEDGLRTMDAQAEQHRALEQDAAQIKTDRALTGVLIERLIDRIEVSHDKQITVRYRFQSEFETYAEVLEQCRNM